MAITNRSDFQDALKQNNREMRALFEAMQIDLAAMLTRYAGEDGKIPVQKSQALRNEMRQTVQLYFAVKRGATGQERQSERAHIQGLIATARKQMRGATERQKVEMRQRVALLGRRLDALEREGVVFVAIDERGQGVSRFGKALMENVRPLIRAVLLKHRDLIQRYIHDARQTS